MVSNIDFQYELISSWTALSSERQDAARAADSEHRRAGDAAGGAILHRALAASPYHDQLRHQRVGAHTRRMGATVSEEICNFMTSFLRQDILNIIQVADSCISEYSKTRSSSSC